MQNHIKPHKLIKKTIWNLINILFGYWSIEEGWCALRGQKPVRQAKASGMAVRRGKSRTESASLGKGIVICSVSTQKWTRIHSGQRTPVIRTEQVDSLLESLTRNSGIEKLSVGTCDEGLLIHPNMNSNIAIRSCIFHPHQHEEQRFSISIGFYVGC